MVVTYLIRKVDCLQRLGVPTGPLPLPGPHPGRATWQQPLNHNVRLGGRLPQQLHYLRHPACTKCFLSLNAQNSNEADALHIGIHDAAFPLARHSGLSSAGCAPYRGAVMRSCRLICKSPRWC